MPETTQSIPLTEEVKMLRTEVRERGDLALETSMQVASFQGTMAQVMKSHEEQRLRSDRQFWLLLGGVLLAPPATIMGSSAASPPPLPAVQQSIITPQAMMQLLEDFRKNGIEIPDLPTLSRPQPSPSTGGF